jgi:photosystem II stability/assembly factor-like uncharacterized protein
MSWQPSRAGVICLLCLVCGLALTQAPTRPNPYPEGDHPEQRVDWFLRFRQSRDSESPAAHRLEALRQARRMMTIHRPRRQELAAAGASPTSIGGDWTELGPKPESDPSFGDVGGRLTAIAVDPSDTTNNTVYLGAADGGLWKSTNALSSNPTFTPIGDNLPSLSIGSIALDATTTPTTIYVGTGEPNFSQDSYYGDGIFKSTDGGQTWTAGTGVDFTGSAISKLLVDPDNPQVLLAAVTEGGVYSNDNLAVDVPAIGIVRSTDNGQTWSRAYSGDHSGLDLVYDASRKAFYAAIRSQGIFQSTDQGESWAVLPRQPFVPGTQDFTRASLAVRGGVLYALITDQNGVATSASDCTGCAGLVASGDGGQTWTLFTPPAGMFSVGKYSQGTYDQFIAAPPGTTALVLGGIDVWSGNPSTNNWTNLTNSYTAPTITVHPDQHAIVCLSASTWIVGNDGGAWSTADGGTSWTNMNATLGAIQFYSVSADPATAGRLIGGSQDNGTAMATAGSLTWPNKFGGDGGHTAINPANPQQVFTENFGVSLMQSGDGGTTWLSVVNATAIPSSTDHGEFYIPYTLDPTNSAQVYLLTQRVWRGPAAPTAPGAGWTPISGDLTHPEIDSDIDPSGDDLTAIAVAPSDGNVVYVGAFDGSLSRTINANSAPAGALPTWTEMPASGNSFAGPVATIAVSPKDAQTLYWGLAFLGGGSAHLFKSSDGGQTKTDISGNLPAVPVNALLIDPLQPNNIYAATDVGVFVASDGGVANEQWIRLGDNLPAAAVLSLSVTSAGGTPLLVAGTHGRGAWSIPLASVPIFSMSLSPATLGVEQGQAGVFQLQTTAVNGPSTLTLDCVNYGPGCTISPATITAGDTATVTVDTSAGTQNSITIHATNGYYQQSVTSQIVILSFGAYFRYTGSTSGTGEVAIGQTASEDLWVSLVDLKGPPYDAPITLSCPSPPAGLHCSFSPATIPNLSSAGQPVTLTVSADSTLTAGPQPTLDIQATGGSVVRHVKLDLTATTVGITATPADQSVLVGTPAKYQATVTDQAAGFSGAVTLTCNVGFGISCTPNPASLTFNATGSQTSEITVLAPASGPGQDYGAPSIALTAATAADAAHASVQLHPQDYLLRPGLQEFSKQSLLSGATSVNLVIGASGVNGFSAPVTLGCANTAASCSFAPLTIVPGAATGSVLTVDLSGLPPNPALPLSITGSADGIQHQVSFPLDTAGDFSLSLAGPAPTAVSGGEALVQVNSTPVNYYNGTLTYSCSSSQGFTCVAPASTPVGWSSVVDIKGVPATGPLNLALTATTSADGVTVSHTLQAAIPVADFSMSADPTTLSLPSQGGTATLHLTFHATNGLSLPVSLRCTGSAFVSCSQLATVTDGAAVDLPIKMSASNPAPVVAGLGRGPGWPLGLGLVLVGIAMAIPRRRRGLVLIAVLLIAGVACGGGGGGGGSNLGGGGGGGGGTQPSIVPITITATDATPGLTSPAQRSVSIQLSIGN